MYACWVYVDVTVMDTDSRRSFYYGEMSYVDLYLPTLFCSEAAAVYMYLLYVTSFDAIFVSSIIYNIL